MKDFKEYKDYSGLIKKNEYDKVKAELLAEAVTEKLELERRVKYLDELISENQDLTVYLWTTLQGECKPLHKITDDHLKNIMGHLLNRGLKINPQIKAEAMSRNIAVPDEVGFMAKRLLEMNEGEIVDRDDIWED